MLKLSSCTVTIRRNLHLYCYTSPYVVITSNNLQMKYHMHYHSKKDYTIHDQQKRYFIGSIKHWLSYKFRKHERKIEDDYDVTKEEIGTGQFGTVYKGFDRNTGSPVAVKIMKNKVQSNFDSLMNEADILTALDHPYIMRLHQKYATYDHTYLVTDLYDGGELFDQIISRGCYGEKEAAHIMAQIISAVSYCHDNRIIHRDIKPENILFKTNAKDSDIVMVDFGTAIKHDYLRDPPLTNQVGSPSYVAPEVLSNAYTRSCDMWSIGVIMYVLLCGDPPFYAPNDKDIMRLIKQGKYVMDQEEWNHVSVEAKFLISRLLERDPQKRMTAREALRDPWISGQMMYKENPLSPTAFKQLKKYNAANKLKKWTLNIIAHRESLMDIANMRSKFESLDSNGDGYVTVAELKLAMRETLHENDLLGNEKILDDFASSVDVSKDGRIEYSEFIAATMKANEYLQEGKLYDAFQVFDKDCDGFITPNEIVSTIRELGYTPNEQEVLEMMRDADIDKDGKLTYEEFSHVMKSGAGNTTSQFLMLTSPPIRSVNKEESSARPKK